MSGDVVRVNFVSGDVVRVNFVSIVIGFVYFSEGDEVVSVCGS